MRRPRSRKSPAAKPGHVLLGEPRERRDDAQRPLRRALPWRPSKSDEPPERRIAGWQRAASRFATVSGDRRVADHRTGRPGGAWRAPANRAGLVGALQTRRRARSPPAAWSAGRPAPLPHDWQRSEGDGARCLAPTGHFPRSAPAEARTSPQRRLGALHVAAEPEQVVGGRGSAACRKARWNLDAVRAREQGGPRPTGPWKESRHPAVSAPRCRLMAIDIIGVRRCARSRPGITAKAVAMPGERKTRRMNGRGLPVCRCATPAWLRAAPLPAARCRCRDPRSPCRDAPPVAPAQARCCGTPSPMFFARQVSPAVGQRPPPCRRIARPVAGAHRRVAEPPGGDIGNGERGVRRSSRTVPGGTPACRAPFGNAAAEPVGDHHLAVAARPARSPGTPSREAGIELKRIGEIGVEPAQQYFSAFEAGKRCG